MPERLPCSARTSVSQFPECFLPGPGEDLRDGHSGPLGDQFVSLHHLPAQRFAQSGGHGGFAAAGHPDENDVPQSVVHGALHPLQGFIADHRAGELLAGALGLSHQHGKARLALGNPQALPPVVAERCGPGYRRGPARLHIEGTAAGPPPPAPLSGIHAHRGGVDDDLGVGVAVQMVVIVRDRCGK